MGGGRMKHARKVVALLAESPKALATAEVAEALTIPWPMASQACRRLAVRGVLRAERGPSVRMAGPLRVNRYRLAREAQP